MAHTNYTITPEEFQGVLPKLEADLVSDYFKQGLSENEVLGILRIDGKKLKHSVIVEVYKHIKTIEKTMVRILNGTSIIYQLETPPPIPNSLEELKAMFAKIVSIDKDKYKNVYDVSNLEDLISNINHVIDNVIEVNTSFEALKNAVNV